MKITKIEQRNNERFSIFIDNELAFTLDGVDVLYHELYEGADLTPECYDFLINEVLFIEARDRALKYLGYRARTKRELENKLSDYPDVVVARVIETMEGYSYIDDYDFTRNYVEARIRAKGFGRERIRRELLEKGVARDIAEEVLGETEFDEVAAAVSKLERRAKGNPIEQCDKMKYTNYLARQGYNYEIIRLAFKEYGAGV